MEKLQNNFTTQEQSKRLLELGVPADSADCCLRRILTDGGYCETWRVDIFDFIGQVHDDYLPCWSVGRLMEIIGICAIFPPHGSSFWCHNEVDYIKSLVRNIEKHIEWFDFSKLEE